MIRTIQLSFVHMLFSKNNQPSFVSPSGQLLLPSEDSVAFVLRRPGSGLHAALHQSVWKQPPCAVLRGVSRPVAHVGAGPLHPAGNIRRALGGAVHQGQHRLVQET